MPFWKNHSVRGRAFTTPGHRAGKARLGGVHHAERRRQHGRLRRRRGRESAGLIQEEETLRVMRTSETGGRIFLVIRCRTFVSQMRTCRLKDAELSSERCASFRRAVAEVLHNLRKNGKSIRNPCMEVSGWLPYLCISNLIKTKGQ